MICIIPSHFARFLGRAKCRGRLKQYQWARLCTMLGKVLNFLRIQKIKACCFNLRLRRAHEQIIFDVLQFFSIACQQIKSARLFGCPKPCAVFCHRRCGADDDNFLHFFTPSNGGTSRMKNPYRAILKIRLIVGKFGETLCAACGHPWRGKACRLHFAQWHPSW